MDLAHTFQTLAISLGLGLLVGIQRERVDAPLAGVRTFALITLFGTLCAMVGTIFGLWLVAAGLLAVVLVTVMGNAVLIRQGRGDAGITTEIAILLMYGIGAYLVYGHRAVAVVLAAGVTVLLHFKPAMHRFVERLGETDMRVMMQFVLISLVILPVLPDRTYGPFDVLNPREIWWMVVLVVGISLGGYIALKLYGERAGTLIAGVIGGLVSSTATTVSFARRAAGARGPIAASAIVILLASTVVYVRVLIEVFVAAPSRAAAIAPPIAILLAAAIVLCFVQWRRTRREPIELPESRNPTELRAALMFGAMYGLVVLGVAAARHVLGDRGVYVAAGISGLTDMDAITLSTSRLADRGGLAPGIVWRAIVIAVLANLVFKGGTVWMLGGAALGRRIALLFAIQAAVGVALLVFWPG
jgi:uncharacterized membrane protein (DUF4010 family)